MFFFLLEDKFKLTHLYIAYVYSWSVLKKKKYCFIIIIIIISFHVAMIRQRRKVKSVVKIRSSPIRPLI